MTAIPERLVRIGAIAKAHGLRGEVAVRPDEPGSQTLLAQKQVYLRCPKGSPEVREIASVRSAGPVLLVRLAGVEDRTAAERLAGCEVLLPRTSLPPAAEGEFYASDLVGLKAVSVEGDALGRVREVFDAGAAPVLVIEGRLELQIPLAEPFVSRVDLDAGEIVVVPPEEAEELDALGSDGEAR